MKCTLCPRNCSVDRAQQLGVCQTDNMLLSRVAKHFWEEPCISGEAGSGAIFFAGCNLHCRFCQNYDISVKPHGVAVDEKQLADIMLYLQDAGVANINLVTPSHFVNRVRTALTKVKPQLRIPVVYNTSSYEKVDAIRSLEGLIDVYLPDLKFCDKSVSRRYAGAEDYFETATKAIAEMRRQQPNDVFDESGYIRKGVILRHLVLPSNVEDSKRILDFVASFDKSLYVSVMSQYFVARQDELCPELNRKLYKHEYQSVVQYFYNLGLTNGYTQDFSSATRDYLPNFDEADVEQLLQQITANE
ncbi:MAG: radical SAM protein [Clostridia bacterium]|nr:radical SAM protein [Clostridia bacterium]